MPTVACFAACARCLHVQHVLCYCLMVHESFYARVLSMRRLSPARADARPAVRVVRRKDLCRCAALLPYVRRYAFHFSSAMLPCFYFALSCRFSFFIRLSRLAICYYTASIFYFSYLRSVRYICLYIISYIILLYRKKKYIYILERFL